jgi:prevent-host-death family protein
MNISLSEAKARLTELVRLAEAGEEVVLTRNGRPVVRLTPEEPNALTREQRLRRRALLEALHGSGKGEFGPDASRATDFLYDEFGLPA